MEKRLFQLLVLFLGTIFLWNIWHPFWRLDLNEEVNLNDEEKVIFEIEKGSSAKTVAENLDDAKLIVNHRSFLRTLKNEGLDGQLRVGRFRLSPSMSLRDIITILTTDGSGESVITILEGWTIEDIDAKLSEIGVIDEGEFRLCTFNCEFEYDFLKKGQSLEGYLFPDTYFLDASTFDVETFIDQLLATFDTRLTKEMEADIAASGRTLQEVISVASMLEKEVNTANDIPIVAGIIWKRLDNDWMLGIDATLLYMQDDNKLTAEELAEDTPYNTRVNTGLPPSAISNPGLASLNGAIYPEESRYWFYLNTLDTGEVIYSLTNEEHNQNKLKYLQ